MDTCVYVCTSYWKHISSQKGRKSKENGEDAAANHGFRTSHAMSSQVPGDADPGVISEGDSEGDFTVSMSS
jgi:hypothetical protein